jgi:phosphoglycolate phosphatase-like HAD superfamily hydrolase
MHNIMRTRITESSALKLLRSSRLVIWDFDGVIKDSVSAKGNIFADIFSNATSQTRQRILDHHHRNGGVSRYVKIPLYMSWCNIPETNENRDRLFSLFARQSFESVVNAPWIEGVQEYLRINEKKQRFYLVTATPVKEIQQIIAALDIDTCFLGAFGSPLQKKEAILSILDKEKGLKRSDSVFIGDSEVDYEAATACGVPFILRGEANGKIPAVHSLSNFL